jgi:hypothetical protein
LEGDHEGFVEAPKGRAGNYTIDEDILLCTTWNNVGMDIDQKGDTYWTTTKEYFDAYNTSEIEQTDRSLRSCWATISSECQKWSRCLAQVERINISSTNDKDKVIISFVILFYFLLLCYLLYVTTNMLAFM